MDDLIQWQSVGLIYMPVNVNKAQTKGVELSSSFQLIDDLLEIIGNYTYMEAKNKSAGEYNDKFLVYRSRHNFNLTLNWHWNNFAFVYDYRSVGKQFSDEANSSDLELKPYDVSDLTLRFYQQFDKFQPTLTFQVRNVFNENYQIIRSYPLPGREFRVNLSVAYH